MTKSKNPPADPTSHFARVEAAALRVFCQTCRVEAGEPCRTNLGESRPPHLNRHLLADRNGFTPVV
jgi:hypothetical protein